MVFFYLKFIGALTALAQEVEPSYDVRGTGTEYLKCVACGLLYKVRQFINKPKHIRINFL